MLVNKEYPNEYWLPNDYQIVQLRNKEYIELANKFPEKPIYSFYVELKRIEKFMIFYQLSS